MDSRIGNTPNDVPLTRDHDSVDDFEHLGHDSSPDDRLEHQQPQPQPQQQHQHQQQQPRLIGASRVDDLLNIGDSFHELSEFALPIAPTGIAFTDEIGTRAVPATPPPSAEFDKCEAMAQSSDPFQRQLDPVDPKLASLAFVETERFHHPITVTQFRDDDDEDVAEEDEDEDEMGLQPPLLPVSLAAKPDDSDILFSSGARTRDGDGKAVDTKKAQPIGEFDDMIAAFGNGQGKKQYEQDERAKFSGSVGADEEHLAWNIRSSKLPAPERSPLVDFLGGESALPRDDRTSSRNIMDDDSWNVVEKTDVKGRNEPPFEPPTKPLPPLPKEAELEGARHRYQHERPSKEPLIAEAAIKEVPPQRSPQHETAKRRETKSREPDYVCPRPASKKKEEIEIAPKEIFRDMGLDAWFKPERLDPKVAGLIYWRDPKKSGIVFGTILGVLLSLAYFSLISVLAYLSLLVLTGTVLFRIYKTVLQAVQKTSDGHPFKEILDMDLTLPAVKVHEVADVTVAHANAAVSELRRLFLVEDFVDSLRFGVLLWILTYVGSWFNGMTLIIIGVVALFTLPKVYETNKEQIDENLAMMEAKINEITAKVKAAIPLGKKAEPTKEE